jgi:hypothetical protein
MRFDVSQIHNTLHVMRWHVMRWHVMRWHVMRWHEMQYIAIHCMQFDVSQYIACDALS